MAANEDESVIPKVGAPYSFVVDCRKWSKGRANGPVKEMRFATLQVGEIVDNTQIYDFKLCISHEYLA